MPSTSWRWLEPEQHLPLLQSRTTAFSTVLTLGRAWQGDLQLDSYRILSQPVGWATMTHAVLCQK